MDIHNTIEDIVFNSVQKIFREIEKEGNPEGFCFCEQCQIDTICYALNRIEPYYIVSNRGFTRMEMDSIKRQQIEADVAALVYKGIRLISHNQRPTTVHNGAVSKSTDISKPVFDSPTITGRIFDGITFAPVSGVKVLLRRDGELATMRNNNWQNPFTLVNNTPGVFSFWPAPIPAEAADIHKVFEYSLKIESSQYETLTHFFKVPSVSKVQMPYFYSLDRTLKLPDLYLFSPGEAEQNDNTD
ncbi:MAG: late competence development ComFB family protein [Treponema sp.]|jgi:competence protein ComFB|nr:late competence development ComFB family protein [Treponema sp.]